MVMEYGVKSPSLNKGTGDVATWAFSQQMLTPAVCAHQQREGVPRSLSTSNLGFSPMHSRKKISGLTHPPVALSPQRKAVEPFHGPNLPISGTRTTEMSKRTISGRGMQ